MKILGYNLRPNYRLKTIKQKFSSSIIAFIQEDIEAFASAFGISVPQMDEIKFESVYGSAGNYDNFVLVPPVKGISASKTNDVAVHDCGIDVGINTSITMSPCSDNNHQEHDYMAPFYNNNDQLMLRM